MVKLNKITADLSAYIYVKLESFNPGGSVKDRPALNMIKTAVDKGTLKPGGTIIEPSSGNTGIGLSMVAAAKNYNCIIVMPDSVSRERIKMLKAYGAEVHLTPADKLIQGAIDKATELAVNIDNSFIPDQFNNPANPEVHRKTTAQEILKQMDYQLDAFVATAGTGGTITGTGEELLKELPDLKIYTVEAKTSPVLAGGKPGSHNIPGTGPGFIPETLNTDIYYDIFHISEKEVINITRRLAEEEGLLLGPSSGAAVWAALQVGQNMKQGQKILAISADGGQKYLSDNYFN